KIETLRLGILWRPSRIGVPGVGARLKRGGLPRRFIAGAVQVMAEEGGFYFLAKLARRFLSAEGNDADGFAFCRLPLAMKPRTGHHEVRAIRIVFGGMPENLPWSPGIFLVPETGDVKIGNG